MAAKLNNINVHVANTATLDFCSALCWRLRLGLFFSTTEMLLRLHKYLTKYFAQYTYQCSYMGGNQRDIVKLVQLRFRSIVAFLTLFIMYFSIILLGKTSVIHGYMLWCQTYSHQYVWEFHIQKSEANTNGYTYI